MTTATLSPKYQIVIPKGIRNLLHLKAGQKLQVSANGAHIEVRPILGPDDLIGMLRGPMGYFINRRPHHQGISLLL